MRFYDLSFAGVRPSLGLPLSESKMFLPTTRAITITSPQLALLTPTTPTRCLQPEYAAQVGVAQGTDLVKDSVIAATPRHFRKTPPAVINLMLPLPRVSPVFGKTVVNATTSGEIWQMRATKPHRETNNRRYAIRCGCFTRI